MLTVKALKNILKTIPTKQSYENDTAYVSNEQTAVLVESADGELRNCHLACIEDPLESGRMVVVLRIDDNDDRKPKKADNCNFSRVNTGKKYLPVPEIPNIKITGIKSPKEIIEETLKEMNDSDAVDKAVRRFKSIYDELKASETSNDD